MKLLVILIAIAYCACAQADVSHLGGDNYSYGAGASGYYRSQYYNDDSGKQNVAALKQAYAAAAHATDTHLKLFKHAVAQHAAIDGHQGHNHYPAGAYSNQHNQYAQPGGSYSTQHNQYAQPGGGYSNQQVQYSQPTGAYSSQHSQYAQPGGSYSNQHNQYAQPGGSYSNQHNQYSQPSGAYSSQHNQYAHQQNGYDDARAVNAHLKEYDRIAAQHAAIGDLVVQATNAQSKLHGGAW